MADCPSSQVNGLIGLISCGAWLIIVGVGVGVTVEVKDTVVGDGVTIVGVTDVVVGINSDVVSVTIMLLVMSTCVVVLVTTDVASVVIVVDGTSMMLVVFGVNTSEDNVTSVVLTTRSVVDDVSILVTDGVKELVSVKLGEGETSSLVLTVVTLGDIVTTLDDVGVGVITIVLPGTASVTSMTLLMLGVMDDIVILCVSLSVNVTTVGVTTSLVALLVKTKLEVGTTLAEGDITVTTVLVLIMSLIDGDAKLIVVTSGGVVVTTSLLLATGTVLGDTILGVGVTLGSIVDGRATSLELIMSVVKVTGKVIDVLMSGCVVTSLVLTTDETLGEIILGDGIILVAGRVMLTFSLGLTTNEILGLGIILVKDGVMVTFSLGLTINETLGEITLGVGIILVAGRVMVTFSLGLTTNEILGLGIILVNDRVMVTFSLVLITSLNVVTGTIVVLMSGCGVVRKTSLVETDGSIGTLDVTLGVIILVTSDDGEKDDTSSTVVTMLMTELMTLVIGDAVKLKVSIIESVIVGEIISLVTSLVMAVTTDVGVTGRVKIVSDTSAILVKVTITLGTDDVMILEMSSDGNVVKYGGSNDNDDDTKLGLAGISDVRGGTKLVKVSLISATVVDGVMTSVSLIIVVSLMDIVMLGTSVVNVSITSLLGLTNIALVILNIGLAIVEVETGVVTTKIDDEVILPVVNNETSSLITDGVGGNIVSTGLNVGMSVKSVVCTVVLGSEVRVTTSVSGVGVSTRVVSSNGVVDMTGVAMMEETASDAEVSTTDVTIVSSMDTTVVGTLTSVNIGKLVKIISLCVDKLNSLEDGVTINENTDVGVTVNVSGTDVSMSVIKGEVVATGTEDETGTLINDETGMLVLGSSVRTTDVGSIDISVLLNSELVVMKAVGSNDVKVSEGVITTSVLKELGTIRLENGIDNGTLVTAIPNDVLGTSDVEVVTKSEVLKNAIIEDDVINGGKLDSIDVNVEVLIDCTSDTLDIIGVINDWVISIVVWSADNKDDVVGIGNIIVVSSTDNTGEDGNIVTTGVNDVVKMESEENVIIGTVVTGCTTEVDIMTMLILVITGCITEVDGITAILVVTISVVAVVWTI